jgi:hypothetical protein
MNKNSENKDVDIEKKEHDEMFNELKKILMPKYYKNEKR